MSEQVSNQNGYPDKIWITIDGQEREVYDTDNMFPYLAVRVKMRDRAAGDPAVRPDKDFFEEAFERGWDIQKYLDRFINDPVEFNQHAAKLAREQYRLRDATADGTEASAQAWAEWYRATGSTDEFKLLRSQIFEVMAPWVEADGRLPIELTT